MKKYLKKILLGITLPQEYLCFSLNDFKEPLKMVINNGSSSENIDLKEHHLFIGYKPLIIAIDCKYLPENIKNKKKTIRLLLLTSSGKKVASLELKFVKKINLELESCILYEGVEGNQTFSNHLQKLFKSLHYKLTSDKKKNIYLAGNLYDQIKIAYSIPRQIYLASLGSDNLFNIFPTDLSGPLGTDGFITSLRSTGKANSQIEKFGKCLVAQMDSESFGEVYGLGKNHMKELSNIESIEIPLRDEKSITFNLPIPLKAIKYFELEKLDKFDIGIHTIHFWKVINSVIVSESSSILAHIHRDYAEWRIKKGIQTNYLMRKI